MDKRYVVLFFFYCKHVNHIIYIFMPVTTAAKPTSGPTTVTQGDESMYERDHAYTLSKMYFF